MVIFIRVRKSSLQYLYGNFPKAYSASFLSHSCSYWKRELRCLHLSEPEDYEEELRKIYKWNVVGLILSWVVWSPFQSMAQPYFQLYAKELGATPIILSILSFVSTITISFSRILGGYIADKYGRKKIVVYMTAVFSFSYLIYAYAPSWDWLLVGAFLSSVALLYQPALWSIMSDSTPKEKRGKIFSLYNFIPRVLSSIAPLAAIYFIQTLTFVPAMRFMCLLSFTSGLVAFLIRLTFLKETLITRSKILEEGLSFKEVYRDALVFIKNNLLYILIVEILFGCALTMNFLAAYYSVYCLGLSEIDWGYIWTVGGVCALASTLPSGVMIDRIGRKPVILFSTLSFMFGSFIFFVSSYMMNHVFILVLIALVATNIGSSIFFIVYNAIVTDMIPLEFRGRVNSVLTLLTGIVNSFVALLAGYTYARVGANVPFLISTIITLFTITTIVIKIRETK